MTDLIVETPDVELDVDGVAVIGGASYTAGAGIDITNNVISVDDTVALNSDVVHKTGDEIINGTKTFENQSIFIGETNGCDSILVGNGVVAMGIGAYGISADGDTENHGFIAFPDTTQILPGTYKEFAPVETIEERVDAWDIAVEFVENRLKKSLMEAISSGKLVIKEKNVSPEYFIKNLIGNNFIKKEERQQFFGTYPI